MHIRAGLKVKQAGMELSEYIMPGLGGRQLSELHATETADALNQIDPHFIRLRTLTIPENYQIFSKEDEIPFIRATDLQTVQEIQLFVEKLDGITSTLKSDHMMNLLQTVEGTFPQDKTAMLDILREFLELQDDEKMLFQVGRRFGFLLRTEDLKKEHLNNRAREICDQLGITPDNVDKIIEKHVGRSI